MNSGNTSVKRETEKVLTESAFFLIVFKNYSYVYIIIFN